MIDKALLDKIRKCFALARSANEHEAAAALAKARELMETHGITEQQLAMAEIEEASARGTRAQRPPKWEQALCLSVRRALGVIAYINADGDRVYVGRGATPEIASYAFAVLFRRLKAARTDYIATHLKRCKPGRKRQRADIFCEAWATSVYRKIVTLVPERAEDELVDLYLIERHPDLVNVSSRGAKISGRGAANDYWRGRAAGAEVDLHAGVGGAHAPSALT